MGIQMFHLENGACVGLCVLEIVTVPQTAKLAERPLDAVRANKRVFVELLGTLHRHSGAQDTAAEILYITEAVQGQPYKAQVKPFVVLRKYGLRERDIERDVARMADEWQLSLRDGMYGLREADEATLNTLLANVSAQDMHAVVKTVKTRLGMQPGAGGYCYADVFGADNLNNFTRLMDGLSHYPNIAVAMQLIPTRYTQEESAWTSQMRQALSFLVNGYPLRGQVVMRDEAAKMALGYFQQCQENSARPLFLFGLFVAGGKIAVDDIANRLQAALKNDDDGHVLTEMSVIRLQTKGDRLSDIYTTMPWNTITQAINANVPSVPYFARLPFIIHEQEAGAFFRLPIDNGSLTGFTSTIAL